MIALGLLGVLTFAHGCDSTPTPECAVDDDCTQDDSICAAGVCTPQLCGDGDMRECAFDDSCAGTQACADGSWTACEQPAEICDGIDNNCDGQIDETFAGLGDACAVGEGECRASGTIVCGPDAQSTTCDAEEAAPSDETCDALDNDCDGTSDEALGGDACDTGEPGACAAGTSVCDGGVAGCVPTAQASDEVCNAIDDDCDGEVDNVADVGTACAGGVGACAFAGTQVCDLESGAVVCDAAPAEPGVEICNGIDDDCDGEIDNVDGLGVACGGGVGACVFAGTQICDLASGQVICDATPPEPGQELCNGIDDDCDGEIDNVQGVGGVGDACEVGVGACMAQGTVICSPAGLVCDATPSEPGPGLCGNGIDDDCDGDVDDDAECVRCGDGFPSPGERCDDGARVDGDGCSALCQVEDGFVCRGDAPDVCWPRCEADADCAALGTVCLDRACVPRPAFCGDGNLDAGEDCDDGNSVGRDGCSADCMFEPGFVCEDLSFQFGVTDSIPSLGLLPPNYTVAEGGRSVTQAANGRPSHYSTNLPVSAEYVTRFEIRVDDQLDDDMVGWTIGGGDTPLSAPDAPYLLFSWKKTAQAAEGFGQANPGLRVGVVDGAPIFDELWQFAGEHVTEIALGETLGDAGWVPGQTYLIELIGNAERLTMYVDGEVEMTLQDVPVNDGLLGIYSFSQSEYEVQLISPAGLNVCSPRPAFCGDGNIDAGEDCDDGNQADADGCSADCALEPGFVCEDVSFALGETDTFETLGHVAPQWDISDDGLSIVEALNSWPTHYATNLPIGADYTTRFDIEVTVDEDDDLIGWTIGGGPTALTAPAQPYLLFSWMQAEVLGPDGEPRTGLRVYRIDGAPSGDDLLWGGGAATLLAVAETRGTTPWRNLQAHTIEIVGDGDRVQVFVDNTLEFDLVDAPLGDRTLGFYANSQPGARFDLRAPLTLQVCGPADPCGNGSLDAGEACDDGNRVDADGCSAECALEPGFACEDVSFALGETDTFAIPGAGHRSPQWNVFNDGLSIIEIHNSWPTHYATNLPIGAEYVTRFDAQVTVNEDDDLIGWTIGGGPTALTAPDQPYLLFSWMQAAVLGPDGEPRTGLRVYRIDGAPAGNDLLWGGGAATLLAVAETRGTTPWRNLEVHTIEIVGNADRVRVFVDGTLEFDLANAPVGDRTLGFYANSQPGARFDLSAPLELQICQPTEICDEDADGNVDCTDASCAAHPNCIAAEICNSGNDEDGDGATDCDDADCAADPACLPVGEACNDGFENDGDGEIDCNDDDCVAELVCVPEVECPQGDRYDGRPHGVDNPMPIGSGFFPNLVQCGNEVADAYMVLVCAGGQLNIDFVPQGASTFRLQRPFTDPVDVQNPGPDDFAQAIYTNETGRPHRMIISVDSPTEDSYLLNVRIDGCPDQPTEPFEACLGQGDADGDGVVGCLDEDCANEAFCQNG